MPKLRSQHRTFGLPQKTSSSLPPHTFQSHTRFPTNTFLNLTTHSATMFLVTARGVFSSATLMTHRLAPRNLSRGPLHLSSLSYMLTRSSSTSTVQFTVIDHNAPLSHATVDIDASIATSADEDQTVIDPFHPDHVPLNLMTMLQVRIRTRQRQRMTGTMGQDEMTRQAFLQHVDVRLWNVAGCALRSPSRCFISNLMTTPSPYTTRLCSSPRLTLSTTAWRSRARAAASSAAAPATCCSRRTFTRSLGRWGRRRKTCWTWRTASRR